MRLINMPNKSWVLKDGNSVVVQLRDDGDAIIKEIDSYTFKNGEKAVLFLINHNKYMFDHYVKYISPKNKNFDVKGLDKNYTYGTLYFNCVRMATVIHDNNKKYNVTGIDAGKELFKTVYDVFKINDIDTKKVDEIVERVWFIKSDDEREFLRQLLITIHYGFYAEDGSLKEKTSKYLFGRKYNLVKIYMVLIEKKDPLTVHKMWNRDGISAEEKDKTIREYLRKITAEFDKAQKNVDKVWEDAINLNEDKTKDRPIEGKKEEGKKEDINTKNKTESLLDRVIKEKKKKSGDIDIADYWK